MRTGDTARCFTAVRTGHFEVGIALILLTLLLGCSRTNRPIAEARPAIPAGPVSEAEIATNKVPPPEPDAVRDAVKRVLKDTVVIDAERNPNFVAGDFNGDSSQDLAVVIKPEPHKLAELNEEFPTWILRDPLGSSDAKSPRLRIAADDVLLAIIHGYGLNGWRDPQATQTFLLKNAAGSAIQTRSQKEFLAANAGKKMPQIRGDVVSETILDKRGYLYYADATYAWYDPQTFTEAPPPRRGHGAQQMKP